jgi:hypothetical protein
MESDRALYEIPFTQYLRPDGRQRQAGFPAEGKTYVDAMAMMIRKGYRFEAEILTTDEVSLTVFDPGREEDIAIEVVANGPDVIKAVARLVASAKEAK